MEIKLSPRHLQDLHSSGLTDETIENLGFYSGTGSEVEAILGFNAGPGLVIPYPCFDDSPPFFRVKPDIPPVIEGKPAKYLSPRGSAVRTYIPPKTFEALKDPSATVIITEGEKKAAKADQEGFACIGLAGVWGFLQNHRLIPDLECIIWKGRPVLIAFDSDVVQKSEVKGATFTLERESTKRGAKVKVIRFSPDANGSKVGLDDFLLANDGSVLKQLLSEGKPALYWEALDIASLLPDERLLPIRNLFRKLAILDPVELGEYRGLCLDCLKIERRDFQGQLKLARKALSQQGANEYATPTGKSYDGLAPTIDPEVRQRALALLHNPALLYLIGDMVQKLGVAGESSNVRIIYLAVISNITRKPISITVKGESSSGKSFLVGKVLELLPPSTYILLTGMSRQALFYTVDSESFAHRTIVIFERWGADDANYNIRSLESEGKLIYWVPQKDPRTEKWVTTRVEKEGPTNFIITTTSPELQQENESRHWSLITDESSKVTLEAKKESARQYDKEPANCDDEVAAWRQLQKELKPRRVHIPYANWLAENTPNHPLRIRRDFSKLLTLIEVIALLHQYQRKVEGDIIIAGLEDYFMARELIDRVFAASLSGINDKVKTLVGEVERLYAEKVQAGESNPSVRPAEMAKSLGVSSSSISRWLRPAIEAGLVDVVAEGLKGRIKSIKPGSTGQGVASILPSVEQVAEEFPALAKEFRVFHPLTGEEVTFHDNEPVQTKVNSTSLVKL